MAKSIALAVDASRLPSLLPSYTPGNAPRRAWPTGRLEHRPTWPFPRC